MDHKEVIVIGTFENLDSLIVACYVSYFSESPVLTSTESACSRYELLAALLGCSKLCEVFGLCLGVFHLVCLTN